MMPDLPILLCRRALALALLCGLLLTGSSCSKDDDGIPQPVISYIVEYRLNSVSDVTVDEITYLDESGQEVTISGQREFTLDFRANTGRKLRIAAKGTIELGYVEVTIAAYSANHPTVRDSDELGYTGGGTQTFDLAAELELP